MKGDKSEVIPHARTNYHLSPFTYSEAKLFKKYLSINFKTSILIQSFRQSIKIEVGYFVADKHYLRLVAELKAFVAHADDVGLPDFDIVETEIAECTRPCRSRNSFAADQSYAHLSNRLIFCR